MKCRANACLTATVITLFLHVVSQAAGGHVWWDRVMGELAVSRAIGDHCLRPYVIPEPEVRVLQMCYMYVIYVLHMRHDAIDIKSSACYAYGGCGQQGHRGLSAAICIPEHEVRYSHVASYSVDVAIMSAL
jgi:hypothetical protein